MIKSIPFFRFHGLYSLGFVSTIAAVVLGFHPPPSSSINMKNAIAAKLSPFASNSKSNRRIKNSLGGGGCRQRRTQLVAVFAKKSKNYSGESDSDAAGEGGPPFLTIVAGFVVFLVVTWIFGSVLVWLIGQILRFLASIF